MADVTDIADAEVSHGTEGGNGKDLPKIPTGITGLDEVFEGGLPEGRCILVYGGPGCGKTVLLNEFLYRGVTQYDEPGVFVSFEEETAEVRRNCETFGWDFTSLVEDGKLRFIDFSPEPEGTTVIGNFELDPIVAVIENAVRTTGAKRVAIDSIGALFSRLPAELAIRGLLFQLIRRLKALGATTLFSAEMAGFSRFRSGFGIEEFVADGIIELSTVESQDLTVRRLFVRKLRGAGFRSGAVRFTITGNGLTVYPKIPFDPTVAVTDFADRLGSGIAELDDALGGGIPRGHVILIAGNTGTGKTLLAMHFAERGLQNGEGAVWVALEEAVPQIEKTAAAHGWDFSADRGVEGLRFVVAPLLNIAPDRLLYNIIDAIEETGARRLIIDSVSSLESSVMSKEEVREFLIQVAGLCKTRGVTCLLNYLTSETFGGGGGQLLGNLATNEMRLSSIVDGIVMLRYVERGQTVRKLLNVLKLRGSDHEKGIMTYDIVAGGFRLGKRFEAF